MTTCMVFQQLMVKRRKEDETSLIASGISFIGTKRCEITQSNLCGIDHQDPQT